MIADTARSPWAKAWAIPYADIDWTGGLYRERFETVASVTVPHLQRMFEGKDISHVVENFRIAAGEAEGDFDGTVFGDGDFYKWFEAAVYTAVRTDNRALLQQPEDYIALFARAQQADGYEYQLPNVTAYNETCASLGGVFWAWRMFLMDPKAATMDVLERMLLNVNLAGVSLIFLAPVKVGTPVNRAALAEDGKVCRARRGHVPPALSPPGRQFDPGRLGIHCHLRGHLCPHRRGGPGLHLRHLGYDHRGALPPAGLLADRERIGFEDSDWLGPGVRAEYNWQVVERLVRLIHAMGMETATTEEARQIMGTLPRVAQ